MYGHEARDITTSQGLWELKREINMERTYPLRQGRPLRQGTMEESLANTAGWKTAS
jgi:hypothetical protein